MSEITSEMKAACMGEFKLSYEDVCPKCVHGDDSPCMCNSDPNGVFTNTRAVPWDSCKQIYKTMYALSPAASQLATLKEENERLKDAIEDTKEDLICNMVGKEEEIGWLKERCREAESDNGRLERQNIALKARVAELEYTLKTLLEHNK